MLHEHAQLTANRGTTWDDTFGQLLSLQFNVFEERRRLRDTRLTPLQHNSHNAHTSRHNHRAPTQALHSPGWRSDHHITVDMMPHLWLPDVTGEAMYAL